MPKWICISCGGGTTKPTKVRNQPYCSKCWLAGKHVKSKTT